MKYRKKPVIINAEQWDGTLDGIKRIIASFSSPDAFDYAHKFEMAEHRLHIFTLEGVMLAHTGDWIIKGVQGEVYPCKPDIFALTHEAVQ